MLKDKYLNEMVEEQKQTRYAYERQNKEMGIVKENLRKISLLLCNIKFHRNTFAGSQNVAGRQTW